LLNESHIKPEKYEFESKQVRLISLQRRHTMKLSFEIFPARTSKGAKSLQSALERMKTYAPEYVSVTCGAFGSAREGTEHWLEKVHELGLSPVAHMTSAFLNKNELQQSVENARRQGAQGIVALRGDLPQGHTPKSSVLDLLKAAQSMERVCVSGYPTPHPESRGLDFDWLKAKQDAGANEIITQFVFDPTQVLTFRDNLVKHGITMTLRPGLLPFHNWAGAQSFAAKTGVPVCENLAHRFENTSDTAALATNVAHEFITTWEQDNISQAHLYTLNSSPDWLSTKTLAQKAA
jgi:methylenetetrahydrofolate reductase (NADPH)